MENELLHFQMGHQGIKTIKAKRLIKYQVPVEDPSLSTDPCGVQFSFKITDLIAYKTTISTILKEKIVLRTQSTFSYKVNHFAKFVCKTQMNL